MQKPLNSLLIKPAGPDCNLDCTYCFYLEKAGLFPAEKHRMSESTLEELMQQAMQHSGSQISFAWQGGEPTLMGLPFFEKAVYFQQHYGRNQSVGNGLQTNGTLLDENWAAFLKKYNFLVGLSIDGPQHVHDHYRKMKGGQDSWAKVREGAKFLLDAGVETNALTVLNDYSVQFPEEIYQHHKSLGLNFMQFIPCLEADVVDHAKPAHFSLPPQAYGEFLIKIFDLWSADFDGDLATTSVRFFDSVFHKYLGLQAPQCTMMHECGVYLTVEHNGDVYSCDFYVEPAWKLGNIHEQLLPVMLNAPKQTQFGKIKSILPAECKSCKWLLQCHGGCPKERTVDRPDGSLSYFCESYKMIFEYADARLRELAEKFRRRQAVDSVRQYLARNGEIGRNDACPCGSGKKFKKCCLPEI